MSKTPDDIVAERIAHELRDLGVVEPDRVRQFCADLAAGRLKVADWNLLAESSESPADRDKRAE